MSAPPKIDWNKECHSRKGFQESFLLWEWHFFFLLKCLFFVGNCWQKVLNSKNLLTLVLDKMFYPCICLLGIENLTCATAVCRGVEEEWNGRYGRMKNENPEKSLWRSESNAKEFCLKRPCVFLKTLRSFGTNALMSFSRTLKWRLLRTLFSISSGNRKIFKVTKWRLF